jgi:hypothetical protein
VGEKREELEETHPYFFLKDFPAVSWEVKEKRKKELNWKNGGLQDGHSRI